MESLGLYIHIPFCRRKCHYCDFVSFPGREDVIDAYVDTLLAETRLYGNLLKTHTVDTVFIGGGTPSLLSPTQMTRLLSGLKEACNFAAEEVTIEANPETLNEEKLACYAEGGINRLSMGLQTHEDSILAAIGRRHTYQQFVFALENAKRYFNNINVDTIFALPGQTVKTFEDTLQRLTVLKVPHISCYALKLEEGTKLAAEFSGADEDIDREMYHRSARLLRKTGYLHYETSNFALPGYECRHNLKYWTGGEYLGLGIAAHSYLADATKTRHANTQRLEDYILRVEEGMKPVSQLDELTPEDELTEYLMLRLRLAKGIDETDYTQRFHEEFFCRFADSIQIVKNAGLISVDAMGIRPTLKGFDLQNTLIGEFIKKI